MNDPSIPFIRQYGEWAILSAAKRSAAGWRKQRYRDHTMEVPENKRYLAANSSKRDPNAPRGARFPARPSKRDQALTPDDNDDNGSDGSSNSPNDRRIPVLPPGPSATPDPTRFPNRWIDWNPRPPSDHPVQPIPDPPQLSFSGFGTFSQTEVSTPSVIPWGQINPQIFPPSGTSMNISYQEHPPPCEFIPVHSLYS